MATATLPKPPTTVFFSDPEGSTFKHFIYLDPTHPGNTQHLLEGYSKDKRGIEPEDKNAWLMTRIKTLYWGRYLKTEKALRVTICIRPDKTICTWEHCYPILHLFRDSYEVTSQIDISNSVSGFLDTFYKLVAAGKDVQTMVVNGFQKGKSYDTVMRDMLKYKSIKTVEELITFYRRRLADGHNAERLKGFYTEYLRTHFSTISDTELNAIYENLVRKMTGK